MTNSAGLANDYFWADGILFEEGTVVRSWTPGFVTSGVTFEGGGLNIDTSQGGVLRLRGSDAGARDQISVGARGLLFGGDTNPVQVYSSASGQIDVDGGVAATGAISAASVTSTGAINKVTITPPATSATLTIANGKTLTASNTVTFTGTDGSSVNVGTGGTMMTNPMSAVGDLIIGGSSGAATRLAKGTSGHVLTAGASTVSWVAPTSGAVGARAYSTGAQTLSGTDARLTFTAAQASADTGFTFSDAGDSFTVTDAGWYQVEGGFSVGIVTPGSDNGGGIYVNGSIVQSLYVQHRNPNGLNPWVRFGGSIKLAASDAVTALGFSTGAGSTTQKWLSIVKL
jgi:hypothetical protein